MGNHSRGQSMDSIYRTKAFSDKEKKRKKDFASRPSSPIKHYEVLIAALTNEW